VYASFRSLISEKLPAPKHPGNSTTVLTSRLNGGNKASSQDVTVQRCILILLDLVHVLVAMSNTVFVSVCAPLVAIRFGASDQLVFVDLRSSDGSGGREETAQEGEGGRRGRTRQAKTTTVDRPKDDSHLAGSGKNGGL
jgi:hypothetical protein